MDSLSACMDAYRAAVADDDGLRKGEALRRLELLPLTLDDWRIFRDFCKAQKLPGVLEVTTERFVAANDPPQLEPHLALADQQLFRGKTVEAGKTLAAYLTRHGHAHKDRWPITVAAFKSNRFDLALPLAEQGVADQPKHFGFQATKVKSLWELGRRKEAAAELPRLRSLLGDRSADWAGYVAIAHRLDQPKEARAALDRLVALILDNTILLNPGMIYLLGREGMNAACTTTLRALDASRITAMDDIRTLFDNAIEYGATGTARALGARILAAAPDPYTEFAMARLDTSARHGLTE